ncbi:hypothetical protein CSV63_09100 [Sporosarcina sp. P34]|uniref:hypothetical protein n=1 Tax=Sporosarcina sp. P34 TaxID=2048247 RepID=UPI000C16B7F3|nr:hypothetical protein [Sporosarcina sp. P34]PID15310.1 hypothetical protein CSV63_09100 [Sporosarcina sp. P34]
MKWIGMIVAVLVVMVAMWIVVNKSYYPSLPIENLSAKEVIGQLNDSDLNKNYASIGSFYRIRRR